MSRNLNLIHWLSDEPLTTLWNWGGVLDLVSGCYSVCGFQGRLEEGKVETGNSARWLFQQSSSWQAEASGELVVMEMEKR